MNRALLFVICVLLSTMQALAARDVPIDSAVLEAIASETSGEAAKRNLDEITLHHRMRAGSEFRAASEQIQKQLKRYG